MVSQLSVVRSEHLICQHEFYAAMHIKTLYQISAVCFKHELVIAESPVGYKMFSTLIEVTQTLEAAGLYELLQRAGWGR